MTLSNNNNSGGLTKTGQLPPVSTPKNSPQSQSQQPKSPPAPKPAGTGPKPVPGPSPTTNRPAPTPTPQTTPRSAPVPPAPKPTGTVGTGSSVRAGNGNGFPVTPPVITTTASEAKASQATPQGQGQGQYGAGPATVTPEIATAITASVVSVGNNAIVAESALAQVPKTALVSTTNVTPFDPKRAGAGRAQSRQAHAPVGTALAYTSRGASVNVSNNSDASFEERFINLCSNEAEQAVIGSLLIDRDVIETIERVLTPDDFFFEENRLVYDAVLSLFQDRVPGDLITLRDYLKKQGKLGDGEGQIEPSHLLLLMRTTATPVHAMHYAKIVKRFALARKLFDAGMSIAETTINEKLTEEQLLKLSTKEIEKVQTWWSYGNPDGVPRLFHEDIFDMVKAADEKAAADDQARKKSMASMVGHGYQFGKPVVIKDHANFEPELMFGFPTLDGVEDPWNEADPKILLLKGTLTMLLAFPSVGKTMFLSQLADMNAQFQGAFVLYCHNELTVEQVVGRRHSRMSQIPFWKFMRRNKMSDHEVLKETNLIAEIDAWPGRVDFLPCPGWNVNRLSRVVRQMDAERRRKTGRGYDMIIWDYLQSAAPPDGMKVDDERAWIDQTCYQFRNLLTQMNVAGVVASQVKREAAGRDYVPGMFDGKGGGGIEAAAQQLCSMGRVPEKKEIAVFRVVKSTFGASMYDLQIRERPGQFIFEEVPEHEREDLTLLPSWAGRGSKRYGK